MNRAPAFTHDDDGTDEPTWWGAPVWDEVPAIDVGTLLGDSTRVVVVSAHPDDETIGAGATIAALGALGARVTFVLATRGEASHPDSPVWSPDAIAGTREAEWVAATTELVSGSERVLVGVPDGDVTGHVAEVEAKLASLVDADTLVLAPWSQDAHPDHDACGAAASRIAQQTGARVAHYPVWWWQWATPSAASGLIAERAVVVEPGPLAVRRKHVASDRYASQIHPLGPGPGHGAIVGPQMRARTARQLEVFFVSPGSTWRGREDSRMDDFDAMYDDGPDPWQHESSTYEARRRGIVLAMLGRPTFRRVLEIGCATGLLTMDLARRADRVDALDVSARALDVAQQRGLDNVTWTHGSAPDALVDLPDGTFDLIVLSEVGYFLRPAELAATLRHVRRLLTPDGEFVAAHWRHLTTGIPSDGPLVHAQIDATIGLPGRATYDDADLLVQVWGEGPSAARREGLV